jgi:hypothetical protein
VYKGNKKRKADTMTKYTEKMKQAVKTLNCFHGFDKLYWLNVMVTQGTLSKAEAGYIIVYKLI